MNARIHRYFSLADFTAWEELQSERHEFYRGDVFATVHEPRVHGRVVSNLSGELRRQLKGTPCQVFTEGLQLQIGDDTVLYPDVFVTCDKADLATERIFRAPSFVVEVLSPTTQAYDRSQKFALYRRLDSLREYVLVDPEIHRVESFRRTADGQWTFHDMSQAEALEATSIGCAVALADVFDGVDPPAEPTPPAD